jgi:hypothetical protein
VQSRFSPNRQGAQHALDEHDLVIVRGTPVDRGQAIRQDSRIWIGRDGQAQRAVWESIAVPVNQAGARGGFHVWTYRLDEASMAKIRGVLDALGEVLQSTVSEHDPNDSVRSLRFWRAGHRVDLIVTQPADPRLSTEQDAAFRNAWDIIDPAVPAGRHFDTGRP